MKYVVGVDTGGTFTVDIVPLSEMPLMGGGYKVLRRELRDRYRKQYEEEKKREVASWGAV